MRRAACLLVAALGIGCYNYEPLRPARLTPSKFVAITLTESGSEELTRYLGPNVHVVRGRFLSAIEQGLSISVTSVESRRGNILEWKGETIVVPGEFIRALDERHVAASKTALLAGASLAGFFVAYAVFGSGASGGAGSPSGAGPGAR